LFAIFCDKIIGRFLAQTCSRRPLAPKIRVWS